LGAPLSLQGHSRHRPYNVPGGWFPSMDEARRAAHDASERSHDCITGPSQESLRVEKGWSKGSCSEGKTVDLELAFAVWQASGSEAWWDWRWCLGSLELRVLSLMGVMAVVGAVVVMDVTEVVGAMAVIVMDVVVVVVVGVVVVVVVVTVVVVVVVVVVVAVVGAVGVVMVVAIVVVVVVVGVVLAATGR